MYVADEGVDRVVALKMFTYRSAEFLYAESKVGSLEPGKYADFVVVENDYLSGPDSEIKNNKVIMTVQADETVYQDDAYKPEVTEARYSADSRYGWRPAIQFDCSFYGLSPSVVASCRIGRPCLGGWRQRRRH